MTLAGELLGVFSWRGIMLSSLMGLATAGAYICYIEAFKIAGSPGFNLGYITRLGLNPWFVVAAVMSAGAIVARPFVFEALGAQRGYFVMVGVGSVVATIVIVSFFKEHFNTYQWIGALMAVCGSILVARG